MDGARRDVIVAPLLSEGYFIEKVIPDRLEGLDCRYSGRTLLPHPRRSGWSRRPNFFFYP